MVRGNEIVNGQRIRCYDNGGASFDRYTVVYMDAPENKPGTFQCVGMSERPFHPQGFGQHSSAMLGGHLGRRVRFADLPDDCRQVVEQDTKADAIA
jgi:hypothetical protein